MRYRPFGATGSAISELTLSLGIGVVSRGPDAAAGLIYAALEAGINSYRLESADPVMVEIAGEALCSVERKLLNVSLVLGRGEGRRGEARVFSAEGMTRALDQTLSISRLGWIDIGILDEPAEDELPQSSLNALKALRNAKRVHALGIAGEAPVMDAYVSTGAFDVLATPLHINSPWQVRSRMRMARERDMVVIAQNYFPEALDKVGRAAAGKPKKGLFGLFGGGQREAPLQGPGGFAFLHQTPNWTAEEICLGHALSDISVASALIETSSNQRLAQLAAVPDRMMPPGLAAQIEMARVSLAGKAA